MKKNFTLIELIVVIAIIAILAAIIASNVFRAVLKSQIAKVEGDLKAIKGAALSYRVDTGVFPKDDDIYVHTGEYLGRGIDFLENKANVSGWDGPYLESWPDNPFWRTERGDQEEGYQWESGSGLTSTFDFNGDGDYDAHVEMGFVRLAADEINNICRDIDKHIDNDDIATGSFVFNPPAPASAFARYRVEFQN